MVRSNGQRGFQAVVITADGRRVSVPFAQVAPRAADRDLLRSLVLGLIGLITGSRRESGGRR
ncbi:MAG: hypothetical protein ACHQZR_01340 [Candidatus Limnocylindrales bacterium]